MHLLDEAFHHLGPFRLPDQLTQAQLQTFLRRDSFFFFGRLSASRPQSACERGRMPNSKPIGLRV